jgi:hypothetical protein
MQPKTALIATAIVLAIAGLLFLAHRFDLVGAIRELHGH